MSSAAWSTRGFRTPGRDHGELIATLADRAFTVLVFVVLALYFCLSDMALAKFGVNYAEGGGSALEKIHPATWLAFATLMLLGARYGNPLRLLDILVSFRGLTLFFLSWLLLFIWAMTIVKTPFTPLIDTFLSAIVMFLLISQLDARNMRKFACLVHAFMTFNALLGIFEYVTGWRLTPYTIGSTAIDFDWRSTAILGHPLGNAALTGAYVVALSVGGGQDLPRYVRPAALGLQLLAMIAFGGRTSLASAIVMIVIVGLWHLARILGGQSFDGRMARGVFFLAPLLVAAIAAAGSGGFFTQFIDRMNDDAGSGNTRLILLTFFQIIPLRDIIFGPDQAYVASLQVLEGTELGIESFFAGFILAYGAIMASIFFVGLFAFCWQMVRLTRPATALMLLFYFIVASTSVSLSVKTITFSILVAMTLSIMRTPPQPDRYV